MPAIKFKILGQEPAFFVSVVEALLAIVLSFGLFRLDQEETAVIVAATSALLGLVTAYATKTTLFSALVGFAKAALVLAVTFGAPLNDNQTASLMAVIVLIAGAYLRSNTYAVETRLTSSSPGEQREQLELLAFAASPAGAPIPVVDVGGSATS